MHKPSGFGTDLRKYEVIEKPRFGKAHPEFEDFQLWFDRRGVSTKLEKSRQIRSLVNRLNPTSQQNQEKTEKDKIIHSIVQTLHTPSSLWTNQAERVKPESSSQASPTQRLRQVVTLEQKRIKRKVLKALTTDFEVA